MFLFIYLNVKLPADFRLSERNVFILTTVLPLVWGCLIPLVLMSMNMRLRIPYTVRWDSSELLLGKYPLHWSTCPGGTAVARLSLLQDWSLGGFLIYVMDTSLVDYLNSGHQTNGNEGLPQPFSIFLLTVIPLYMYFDPWNVLTYVSTA